ncbi:hypothetical protein DFP72DRAFT_1164432 [Ephemerocybe angulata]|uniref:Uncharacterized protein n=1 Tax=Ephemerocybe angulata TaxID=980116 RepID=A0A8H6MEV4_9AGAR|nr:hypothetical protein DFP72DRAFT_1164432 [Tulosesus angulatus]
MKSAMISTATLLVAAGAAQAAWTSPNLYARGENALLHARQATGADQVPPSCLPSCTPVNAELTNNCPPKNCCTTKFTQGYVDCYVCVANAAGVRNYDTGQNALHVLSERCTALGLPVAEPTFPPAPRPSTNGTSTASSSSVTILPIPSSSSSTTPPVQTTVTSVPPSSTIPQSTVTSIPTTTATTAGQSSSTGGAGSGAVGLRMEMGAFIGWVLPLVATAMGVLLL